MGKRKGNRTEKHNTIITIYSDMIQLLLLYYFMVQPFYKCAHKVYRLANFIYEHFDKQPAKR